MKFNNENRFTRKKNKETVSRLPLKVDGYTFI